MKDEDYVPEVLGPKGRFKFYKYSLRSALIPTGMAILVYVATLFLQHETITRLIETDFMQSLLNYFPLDYWRFIHSNNPSIANRVWLVEFAILSLIAVTSLVIFYLSHKLVTESDGAIGRLSSLSVLNGNIISSILMIGFVILYIYSGFSEKVINGNYSRSLGANDLVIVFNLGVAFCLFLRFGDFRS